MALKSGGVAQTNVLLYVLQACVRVIYFLPSLFRFKLKIKIKKGGDLNEKRFKRIYKRRVNSNNQSL